MKFTSCIMSAVCGALFLFAGASALGNGSNTVVTNHKCLKRVEFA